MAVGAKSLLDAEKGYAFPTATFELSPEWVAEYAAAVEEGAIGALDRELVPPMALAALAVRSLLEATKLPPGTLHVAQELACRRPVRLGERLSARARVASRGERAGWVLMGVDLLVEDGSAVAVMTGRATITIPAGGSGA